MNYNWTPAETQDIQSIIDISKVHFTNEIDNIFTPNEFAGQRNLTLAIVNQYFSPLTELLSVCKDDTGKLIAYTWAVANQHMPWSDDNMVNVKIAHIDLTLPPKLRIKLVLDMFTLWETFAKLSSNPIVCSSTIRHDQDAFLKLHEKHGYSVRGSFAFKRLF
jgi:hypothetical protein